MLIVQLVHKVVREIPGSADMSTGGLIFTSVFAGLLMVGIILNLLKNRLGLILGIICATAIIFQPIFVHIIKGEPDQNGIWWYPIFPWTQALLILYFCLIAWNKKEIYEKQ
ncbi:MAG: hypothetical protein ACTSYA_13230 [Candidatus Kariarchaeaceae archaeon]